MGGVMTVAPPQHQPKPKIYPEKIGDREYTLEEAKLDVFEDVALWSGNPRLQPYLPTEEFPSEDALENYLRMSKGYEHLYRSIAEVGQMEPVYVWKGDGLS